MSRNLVAIGAVLGMISVILGAFGAHTLKESLSPAQLVSFETGVKYQMYHALFLLLVGFSGQVSQKRKSVIGYLVVIGIILFSGSIYLLSTREITGIDIRSIAFITPIGGLLLIVSWLTLLIDAFRKNHKFA